MLPTSNGDATLLETHCHLNNPRRRATERTVLGRAREVGVDALIMIGYDLTTSHAAAELASPDDGLHAAVGIHPHEVPDGDRERKPSCARWPRDPAVVAIGEIGLDFYRDLAPREAQYPAFEAQLALARGAGSAGRRPHARIRHRRPGRDRAARPRRAAGPDALLERHGRGGPRARGLGLLLGVGGVLTYKKPGALAEVVAEAPLESLVLETDSPYLPPVPHRGERNEPGYLPLVARRLAEYPADRPGCRRRGYLRHRGRLLQNSRRRWGMNLAGAVQRFRERPGAPGVSEERQPVHAPVDNPGRHRGPRPCRGRPPDGGQRCPRRRGGQEGPTL